MASSKIHSRLTLLRDGDGASALMSGSSVLIMISVNMSICFATSSILSQLQLVSTGECNISQDRWQPSLELNEFEIFRTRSASWQLRTLFHLHGSFVPAVSSCVCITVSLYPQSLAKSELKCNVYRYCSRTDGSEQARSISSRLKHAC